MEEAECGKSRRFGGGSVGSLDQEEAECGKSSGLEKAEGGKSRL